MAFPPGYQPVCLIHIPRLQGLLFLRPDLQAIRADTFVVATWPDLSYAFLPPPLMSKALTKVEEGWGDGHRGGAALDGDDVVGPADEHGGGGDGGAGTLQGRVNGEAGGEAPQARDTCGHGGEGQWEKQPLPLTAAAQELLDDDVRSSTKAT